MAEKTAEVRLKAHVSGFIADMRKAGQAMKVSGADGRALAADLDYIGNRALAMGGGLVVAIAGLANVSRQYDAALSGFKAVTGATDDQVSTLGTTAQDVGRQFGVSAHEVVDAGTALAKAGVGVTDVLGGGLQGALALSATGSLELADAAEIAAIAMHQFNLDGSDIPRVADMMSKGANDAVGDVRDLAWALRQSGLVAGQFGLDLDATVGTLSMFAQQGLIGSDAGTSFKSMLLGIAGPSGVAKTKMEELGLSFYDSNGQFIGLAETADMLQTQLGHLSEEQRNAALATIFGQDAIRSANILYKEGGDAVRWWSENVNDAGYASELAQAKLDNLNGDLSKLKVAAENAVLNGTSGLNQSLRDVVQGLTGFMDGLANMDPVLAGNVVRIAAISAGLLLLVGGLAKGASAVLTGIEHWRTFNTWLGKVEASAGRTGKAIAGIARAGAGALALTAGLSLAGPLLLNNPDQTTTRTDFNGVLGKNGKSAAMTRKELDQLFADQWQSMGRNRPGSMLPGMQEIGSVSDAMRRIFRASATENIDDFGYTAGFSDHKSTASMMRSTFAEADAAIAGMVQSGNMEAATKSFREFKTVADEGGYSVQQLGSLFPQYSDAVSQTAAAQEGAAPSTERLNNLMTGNAQIASEMASESEIAAAQQEALGAAFEETGVTVSGLVGDMEKFLDMLFQTGVLTMSARDAESAWQASLDGISSTVTELTEKYGGMGAALNKSKSDFDLTSEAGRTANNAYQTLARDGMERIRALSREGMGQPELQGKLSETYRSLVHAAEGMGITGQNAIDLARKVLGVPDNVDIDTWMSQEAKRIAEATAREVDALDGKSATVTITTKKVTELITKYRSEGTPSGHARARDLERGVYGAGRAAEGGRVVGPGGPKDDILPFWLSNGEYVLDAEDVKAMGGFNAIDRMRRQLHATGAGALMATATSRAIRHAMPQIDYDAISAASGRAGGGPIYNMPINVPEPGATGSDIMRYLHHSLEVAGRTD